MPVIGVVSNSVLHLEPLLRVLPDDREDVAVFSYCFVFVTFLLVSAFVCL